MSDILDKAKGASVPTDNLKKVLSAWFDSVGLRLQSYKLYSTDTRCFWNEVQNILM